MEHSQRRGTIHWGSEKSLTEAIYFTSWRESLFFTSASAVEDHTAVLLYVCVGGGVTRNNSDYILLCYHNIHHVAQKPLLLDTQQHIRVAVYGSRSLLKHKRMSAWMKNSTFFHPLQVQQ